MGDISFKVSEKNLDNEIMETLTNSAEHGIINQREFFSKDISNEKNLQNYYIVKPDDFVYNPRISSQAPVGPINRNKLGRTGVMSPLYYVFRLTEIINYDYLENYFQSTKWHRFMKLNGDSGARSDRFSIKNSVLITMPIQSPSISEQYYIGDFFNHLNNVINLHQRIINILHILKKEYLKEIFADNVKKIPNLRFKYFNKEWERRNFFENIDFIIDHRGKTPKKLGMSWSNEGYLALSALNVKNGYIDKNAEAKYGSEELYQKWMGQKHLRKGYVLFTTEAPMGNVAIVPDNNRYILSQRTIAFDTKKNLMTNSFLATILNTPAVIATLVSLSSGATAKGVSQKSLSALTVKVPKQLEEQNNISQLIYFLEENIHLHQSKLTKFQQLKKEYLNKMFI